MIRAGFRPTIVLLDINLPGDSGWGFLRAGGLAAAGHPAGLRRQRHGRARRRGCASSTAPASCPSRSPFRR